MGKKQLLRRDFLAWVTKYNEWRVEFGFPKMIPTFGLQGGWTQAHQGAAECEETFPTWEELSAGAEKSKEWNFTMPHAGWMFGPRGRRPEDKTNDKNVLRMARWGKPTTAEPTSETSHIPLFKKR